MLNLLNIDVGAHDCTPIRLPLETVQCFRTAPMFRTCWYSLHWRCCLLPVCDSGVNRGRCLYWKICFGCINLVLVAGSVFGFWLWSWFWCSGLGFGSGISRGSLVLSSFFSFEEDGLIADIRWWFWWSWWPSGWLFSVHGYIFDVVRVRSPDALALWFFVSEPSIYCDLLSCWNLKSITNLSLGPVDF